MKHTHIPKSLIVAVASILFLCGNAYAKDHAVEIKAFKFSPANVSVAKGDTITFTNMDGAAHTATALDGSFNTGTLNKGRSKQIRITNAGSFSYKCKFHSAMKGKVSAN